MNEESRLLMMIWESLGDFISKGDKPEAAKAVVAAFIEMGNDARELFNLEGEDEHIDAALTEAMEDEEDLSDEEY